ncbi:related to subtilisin-like serine protease [Phialocephala subalpina]|uniref:Related to subtilisin-like serine protease n=1 Tax=Phialocephala subalpina TaxID=576137 RepID=A0A1L7X5Q8_9HELO|nr:related to subtilisin-like serine protease [Phialocephala subalpina]
MHFEICLYTCAIVQLRHRSHAITFHFVRHLHLKAYHLMNKSFTYSQDNAAALQKAYIIQLSPQGEPESPKRSTEHLNQFHRRALSLDYSVRHEFSNADVFLGISIQVNGDITEEEALTQLHDIPGVISVSSIYNVSVSVQPGIPRPDTSTSSNLESQPPVIVSGNGNLASSLEMGGVDKLHQLGIKGKGIKIGVIDTGVDYRHPALGGGFGPGHKIAGGYSFVLDNGTLRNTPNPLATCYGGGHGTHVSGIIGMDSVQDGFDIVGVAPEASIFMYRVFDCAGHAGSDTIMAAMSKAADDGVDLVSMSLGIGLASFSGALDPLAAVTQMLTDHGIAVIVAQANDANGSMTTPELYTEEWPSTEPTSISVGAISNTHFPLVYSATDSVGAPIQYASVYPLDFLNGADVYIINDGCSSTAWTDALAAIKNVSQTIIAFGVTTGCQATSAGSWNSATVEPAHIMALNSDTSNPYLAEYDTPSQGFFGATQFINLNVPDGSILKKNFAAAGGYLKYKLFFNNKNFTSVAQKSGGMVDYYSSFGPTWHEYDLKPQISAPGGHVLSTWPLGPLGGYAILSGTSMATPYLAGCFALVKSQFPTASIAEIRARLQVNAEPVPWVFNKSMLSATVQQGAGLVNVYDAIFADTKISPGQLKVSDVSKTAYGLVNITVENTSPNSKTYSMSHQGAGYMDYYIPSGKKNQEPMFGTTHFPTPSLTVPAGTSINVQFSIIPPQGVVPSNLPVFGGFIKVSDSDGKSFSVPYAGPPYSLYNTPYLLVQNASQGTQLPEVYAYNADQSQVTYDTGLLEINATNGYGASIPTLQWTRSFRVDVLPANTNITANYYGFDTIVKNDYQPSRSVPSDSIFGYPSFGTVVNSSGFIWPGGSSPFELDDTVMRSNGSKYSVGNGDYRWFASVLREGGSHGVQEDHDTWLGPVMRFVGS